MSWSSVWPLAQRVVAGRRCDAELRSAAEQEQTVRTRPAAVQPGDGQPPPLGLPTTACEHGGIVLSPHHSGSVIGDDAQRLTEAAADEPEALLAV